MGNQKPPYRNPPQPALRQSEIPMAKTKLLLITSDTHMTEAQCATLTAHVQGVADKVGAEVLVLPSGHHAQLIDVHVTPGKPPAGEVIPTESASELRASIFSGRFVPSSAQADAMRMVARLVDAGAVELIDNVYSPGHRVFRCLKIKAP